MIEAWEMDEGVTEGGVTFLNTGAETGGVTEGRDIGGLVVEDPGETCGGGSANTILNGQRVPHNKKMLLARGIISVLRSSLGNLLLPGPPLAIVHHLFPMQFRRTQTLKNEAKSNVLTFHNTQYRLNLRVFFFVKKNS